MFVSSFNVVVNVVNAVNAVDDDVDVDVDVDLILKLESKGKNFGPQVFNQFNSRKN